jgi:hypothetical protein
VVTDLLVAAAGSVIAQSSTQMTNACFQKQTGLLKILTSGSPRSLERLDSGPGYEP